MSHTTKEKESFSHNTPNNSTMSPKDGPLDLALPSNFTCTLTVSGKEFEPGGDKKPVKTFEDILVDLGK